MERVEKKKIDQSKLFFYPIFPFFFVPFPYPNIWSKQTHYKSKSGFIPNFVSRGSCKNITQILLQKPAIAGEYTTVQFTEYWVCNHIICIALYFCNFDNSYSFMQHITLASGYITIFLWIYFLFLNLYFDYEHYFNYILCVFLLVLSKMCLKLLKLTTLTLLEVHKLNPISRFKQFGIFEVLLFVHGKFLFAPLPYWCQLHSWKSYIKHVWLNKYGNKKLH